MLHHFIALVLPTIISCIEILGILVVIWTVIHEFWDYIQNSFMKTHLNIKANLAEGLATGLEFKLAAEILKTVLVQNLDELYVLGAVILLRSLMSLLIHFEMKHAIHDAAEVEKLAEKVEEKTAEQENETV